jgi:hypothetical protein
MHPQAESFDQTFNVLLKKYKLVPMQELLNSSLIQMHTFILSNVLEKAGINIPLHQASCQLPMQAT